MRIFNKRARYEYELSEEKIEAGISLTGGEAKAVRMGHADLSQSYGRILNGELFLINANIPIQGAKDYVSTRSRKLLIHKSELISLATKMKQQKLNLVPISMYNKARLVKVGLALGKPKRKFEKRQDLKKKDIDRELSQELKERV